jgi:type IV fimbrial biogenesis protein FimT
MEHVDQNPTESRNPSEAHMKQEGYTLMELMVVTAVIGIVSALAVPNFSALNSRMQLHWAAEEIASELRLARQLAITHRDRVRITFDLEQQALLAQFVNGAGETMHRVYRYGDKGIAVEEPSTGPEIVFYPSGRSATATTIHLRGKEGQTQTLTIGITGRVSIL